MATLRIVFGSDYGATSLDINPDSVPPYLQNLDPAPLGSGVARNTTITIEVMDDGAGLDTAETIISVDQGSGYVVAFQNGAAQNSFVVVATLISGGYRYVVTPPSNLPLFQQINVRVQAADIAGNPLDETYFFTTVDDAAPTISSNAPTGTGVSQNVEISFSLEDQGSGINQSAISTTVDGNNAIVAGAFQTGYDGSNSSIVANGSNGYDVTIDPVDPFDSADTISVVVGAEDNSGNPLSANWTFDVVDYLGPLVTPIEPGQGGSGINIGSDVTVEVTDEALVSDSIIVEVDRDGEGFEVAYEQGGSPEFKDGWDGERSDVTTISGGYRIVIDPVPPFPNSATVYVRVTAVDNTGNPERLP